jgi:hypothetical protein
VALLGVPKEPEGLLLQGLGIDLGDQNAEAFEACYLPFGQIHSRKTGPNHGSVQMRAPRKKVAKELSE